MITEFCGKLLPRKENLHTMDTKENILAGFASYILASGSPRRIEMMRRHGIEPLILPAQIEETLPPRHDMYETVMFLALKKRSGSRTNICSRPAKRKLLSNM